ncbi:MAG: MaoC family dehydratase N-terminal domain-containing protein [Micromonosporaceae bacterium]
MPLDPSFAGRTYPPTEPYLVGREKIREFADAIGATDAAYHDPAAAQALGYPDVIAPPTFPILLSMVANQSLTRAMGFAESSVVHGDQRFAYTRPVHAGDRLVCVTTVEDVMSRVGNDFVTTRTEMSTEDGEPVVTVSSRLVIRGEG